VADTGGVGLDYQVDFLMIWPYAQAATHAQVLNKSQIADSIMINIPSDMAPTVDLTALNLVLPADDAVSLSIETIVRDGHKPWLQVPTSLLEITAGYHLYKFTFHDSVTNSVVGRYLAYMIQDDKPVRPYYYMDQPVVDDGSQESVGPSEPELD
jgi:hypothetical protein